MKSKSLVLILFALAICCISCSKSTPDTPSNPIVGLWIGTLTAINEPQAGPLQYSFDIRADSTILTESEGADGNTYYSAGSWTLIGTTFSAVITSTSAANRGTVQKLTATYSNTNGTLSSGIWGDALGNANGTFSLNRIN